MRIVTGALRGSAAILVAFALLACPVLGDIAVRLTGRVVDQAEILSNAEEARLVTKSADLEARTGNQLVIVTLSGLEGRSVEDWGLSLGRGWGIGQGSKDSGVLLIVAPNDRAVRIEVGYGLEGTLTDATAGRIVRNVIIPRFKAGDMPDGISDGVDAIASVLSGSGETFEEKHTINPVFWIFMGFFGLGFAMFGVVTFIAVRHAGDGTVITTGSTRDDDDDDDDERGSSSRSSSSGSGFRGGGGSFGGGGASGRW